ncbi:hypothetical protein GCM10023080_031690 [Streptomyces pseudoechinosporeus]
MIYLGNPQDAISLLGVAAMYATLPATKALVASQTGRVTRLSAAPTSSWRTGSATTSPSRYLDAAEHAGARAVSARDLTGLNRGQRPASIHFEGALKLRKPGFDRVRVMDRVGLAAALFDEGEAEQGAAAARQSLDDTACIDSTLVASRLNTLLNSARPYETAAVNEVCTRAKELAAARPTTADPARTRLRNAMASDISSTSPCRTSTTCPAAPGNPDRAHE